MTLTVLMMATCSPMANADSTRGVVICSGADMEMMPANWDVPDQSCVRVDLGVLQQGETISFDISTDSEIDILLFSSNAITVYQNEQSYRSDSVWESDSVFESFNGTGDWHWTVPSDRDATRWYMVIDNLAHPQDGGLGDQGGDSASVTLDASTVVPAPFTLVDTIVRLESGQSSTLYGPFSMDTGTQVRIDVSTMQGAPDVFLMDSDQLELYNGGGTAAARIQGTDLLLVTSNRDIVWTVPESLEGQDLYLVVDNKPGPSGGGAGTLPIASTVVLSLTPIMDPTVSGIPSSGIIDVGSEITLDASATPNLSNQIPESGYSWDTDGDGFDDNTQMSFNISWPEPSNLTIRLSVLGADGRSTSVYEDITVEDLSPPVVEISVDGILERSFNENIVIDSTFTDNWGVSTVEWLVDGELHSTSESDFESARTFTYTFPSEAESGLHLVTLRVTDLSGMTSEDTASIQLFDSTPPVPGVFDGTLKSTQGVSLVLEVPFEDQESESLFYSWDFNAQIDSDGDGTVDNDEDAIGPTVEHIFSESGVYRVICRVQNDEGLVSNVEILVTITNAEDGNEIGLNELLMGLGALALLAVISFLAYLRIASNRRIAALMADSEREEKENETVPREITAEEQKAMWGGASTTFSSPPMGATGGIASGMSGTSSPDSGTASLDISDEEFAELLSEPSPSKPSNSIAADLLSEFEDEDDPTDDNESVVDYKFPEDSEQNEEPEESQALVEPTQSPELNLGDDNTGVENRTVRKNCSECDKMFEVDLPEGVDRAKTACPHCGSIEVVGL